MKQSFGATELYRGLQGAGVDLSTLSELPWPVVHHDDWKYSDLTRLAARPFHPVTRMEGGLPAGLKDLVIPEAVNLVFVNGLFSEALSELAKVPRDCQVTIGDQALASFKVLSGPLSVSARNDSPLFLGMNRAFLKDVLLIDVPPLVDLGMPFHIIHLLDSTSGSAAIFPRVFLRLGRGARAKVMETNVSFSAQEYFHNPVTEAVLGDGAYLEYIQAHRHAPEAFHVGSYRFWLEKDARLQACLVTNGARIFRSNVSVMLQGEGADVTLNGIHLLKDERHADSHTFIDHIAPSAKSHQLYKSILDDKAHSAFNGKVLVRQQAQLTNSYQLNKNLLLSRTCKVDTKPQLEINADDVKCSHGATVGQLDDDELFYLETRGINRDAAQRMLVRAFIDDVLETIAEPCLRTAASKMAEF